MAIVSCPECGKKLKIADTSVGKKVKCSGGHIFVADTDSAAAVKPAPAAVTPEKVYVACTECEAKLKVPTTSLGKKMKCPKCAAVFVAQIADAPAPKPAAKPAPATKSDEMDDFFSFAQEDAAKEDSGSFPDDEESPKPKGKAKPPADWGNDEDVDDAPKPKGKTKPPAPGWGDEDDRPRSKGKPKPKFGDDADDAKPVYPSRLIPTALAALLILVYLGGIGIVFMQIDGLDPAKLLGLPEAKIPPAKKKDQIDPALAKKKEEENKKEAAKLNGAWIVESATAPDKGDFAVGQKLVFDNGKVTLPNGAPTAFSVDADESPKWIDLPVPGRPARPGIYMLNGDTLQISAAVSKKSGLPGKEIMVWDKRPTKLDAALGELVVLKRDKKPDDKEKTPEVKEDRLAKFLERQKEEKTWLAEYRPNTPDVPGVVALLEHEPRVVGVAFAPKAALLASVVKDNTEDAIKVWDLKTLKAIKTIATDIKTNEPVVAFAPKGDLLAILSNTDKAIRVWSDPGAGGNEVKAFTFPKRPDSLAFSSDGKLLSAVVGDHGEPREIKIWQLPDWKERPFTAKLDNNDALFFGPDGDELYQIGLLGDIVVHDLATGKTRDIKNTETIGSSPRISPDGRFLAFGGFGGGPGALHLLDLQTLKKEKLADEQTEIRKIQFSPDGKYLLYQSGPHHLVDIAAKKKVATVLGAIDAFAFSPGGVLLARGEQGQVRLAAVEDVLAGKKEDSKDKKKLDDKKAGASKIEGNWVIESALAGGMSIDASKGERMGFNAGKVTGVGPDGTYTTDETKTPRWVDLVGPDKMTLPGIYKLEDGKLHLAFPSDPKKPDRPKAFDDKDAIHFICVPAGKSVAGNSQKESQNNLKQIGLALLSHHDAFKTLPPAGISGGKDETKPLLSWRVAILPFIEQVELYQEFKLDEPWDSSHNKKLLAKMPKLYAMPGVEGKEGVTHYRAFVGPGTPLEPQKGPGKLVGSKLSQITDGTSNTIVVVEAKDAIEWTRPDDLPYDPKGPLPKLGVAPAGFNVLFLDGTVRLVAVNVPDAILRPYLTRDNGIPRMPLVAPPEKGTDEPKEKEKVKEKETDKDKKSPDADIEPIVKKLGGFVTRDDKAPGKPVVEVNLRFSKVTDDDLKLFAGVKTLRKLDIGSNKSIKGTGLRDLGALDSLDSLDVSFTPVDDEAVKHLAGLKNLKVLSVLNSSVTGEGLKTIAELGNLEELSAGQCKFAKGDVKALGKLKNLRRLELGNTLNTDDDACKAFGELDKLEKLILFGTKVSDLGMKDLGKLKNLKELAVGFGVGDDGLKELAGLPELQKLSLNSFRVTDKGMKIVAGFKNLKEIDLFACEVGDAGVKELAGMESLKVVGLQSTKITDAALTELANMKQLTRINLFGTKVSAQAVADLKKALPKCQINK